MSTLGWFFSKSHQRLGITWYRLIEITWCPLRMMKRIIYLSRILYWKRNIVIHKIQRNSFRIIKLNYIWKVIAERNNYHFMMTSPLLFTTHSFWMVSFPFEEEKISKIIGLYLFDARGDSICNLIYFCR